MPYPEKTNTPYWKYVMNIIFWKISSVVPNLRNLQYAEFDSFVQNYNMHSMGKTINELHAMLKLHEQTLPKNNAPALHAIRAGKDQKKRNCPHYLAELLKKKNTTLGASGSGLRASRKLKPGALSLYVDNGQREAVEAIGVFHLSGFVNCFVNNTIQVSRNNMVYFSAIPRDGIFEIDLSNSYANDSSMYVVSNKRAKLDLDSALLWHCHLGHISKKRIKKLQHDGLLNSTDLKAFEKYVSCMSRKMARKPYTHQVERAKDLLRLIHTNACSPFKIVPRQGASYFVTFINDLGRYGYVYLLRHKHEVFETFKVFQKEDHGIIIHHTPPYTPQHNGVSERRNKTLLDMVRSMISQTTLPKSFGDYALETTARILNMVPTRKMKKEHTKVWAIGHAPKMSYLKLGCVPKETMGYSFYYPPENKVLVARNAEFLENSLITQEVSGSLKDLEIIQEEDTHPSRETSLNHEEDDLEIDEPQSDINPIRDLGEPANYKAALLDTESDKWLNAMNVEMQSMKDNEVWDLVDLPPNGKTIGGKWLFKKKTNMDGAVRTYKAHLVAKGFTQTYRVDYEKTFSPVADIRAIRILIAIVAYYDYEIWCFSMKYLGEAAFILGIKIYRDRSQRLIGLCQSAYIEKILKRYHMENSKRGSIPMQDKLRLSKSQGALTPAELKHMQNVPYASVTGYVFVLNGGVVDWKSAKQSIFATSSAKAEYIAAYDASKEAVWVRKFISGLANESAITKGARHFRAKVHYLHEVIKYGDVKLEKVHTYDNLANLFTNALAFPKHSEHTRNIGMLPAIQQYCVLSYLGLRFGLAFCSCVLVTAFWLLKVAFCLLEDLTAFCLKISLRFASRPHCVLLQDTYCVLLEDLTAFCFKTSLRFASSYHCVLLKYHCFLLKTSIAFCLKTILRFDRNNSDDIQAAGSDTRPPMLDRTDYESWSQRIRLYCRGKENGLQILQSIDQGPFELGTTRDTLRNTPEGGVILGPERPHTYDDLDDNEKKRYDADVRATNIVLQGLPKDIYKLINHNIEAKAIWDNVKMLLAGSELTKEDRESQLYDEFERFKMLPGESINEYYVCFHKLVNDIRNIRMTMLNIQLNSKFVNNMSPEWDRFVTTVKLNKVVQNVQGRQNQNQRNFARGNGAAGFGGMQNRAGNANAGQGKPVKCYNYNGVGHIAMNCTQPKRPHNSDYFKDKMLLMQAQENGAVLDEEELLFLADECYAFDSDVDDESTAQTIFMANLSSAGSANPQAGTSNASILSEVHTLENAIDHSVTNQNEHVIHNEVQQSNVIDSTSVHMGNSNVIPYEQYLTTNDVFVVPSCASSAPNNAYVLIDNNVHTPHEPLVTELAIYKEQVAIYEQRAKFELTKREQRMDDQMRVLIQDHVPSSEEDLELAKLTRQKMHEKLNDPVCLEKRIKSSKMKGRRAKGQCPTPACPATCDCVSSQYTDPSEHFDGVQKSLVTEVRAMKAVFKEMEAEVDQNAIDKKYREIERKNLLITNENLIANCIAQDVFYTVTDSALSASRFHDLSTAYNVAMNRVVELESENSRLLRKIKHDDHDTMIKAFSKLEVAHVNLQLKQQHLKENVNNLKSKSPRDVPEFDNNRHLEYKSLDSQNFQLKQTVTDLQNQLEDFKAENAKIKLHYQELFNSIKVTRAQTTEKAKSLQNEIENLRAQLKGKMPCVTSDVKTPKVSAFEKYAIDVEPIPPRLNKNREVHLHYIKRLKENVETLREIVEDAKVERPLDTSLASTCRYTKHSQELLEYVIGMCPKDFGPSDKQNASTNSLRKKRVNFVEPCETSTHNTPPQVEHQKINLTNAPGIPSTGVKGASAASRSKPRSNTKKDRTLPARSALKQVEAHSRMNKSNEKQENRVDSSISFKCTLTGRIFPLGDQCLLTRITKPKALPVKQLKPTGRLIPLDGQCPIVRPPAPTNSPNLVASNLV
ncbi:retrotransposon protein, putative, ty1-copia subclass [Tanacetum coccineum]|uniref:Retrotransposon protein, putative, ty1-copia subclass n=1 Tax=Tanacetum coccineum TaxID=301880 RepID=A0ABQ4ZXG8_9ASTR